MCKLSGVVIRTSGSRFPTQATVDDLKIFLQAVESGLGTSWKCKFWLYTVACGEAISKKEDGFFVYRFDLVSLGRFLFFVGGSAAAK
jgi:hypothetical protein